MRPMSKSSAEIADLLFADACVATCAGEGDPLARLDVRARCSVATAGDRVVYVGPREGAPTARRTFELAGASILPGLVDPHTHLVFAGTRVDELSRRMRGEDYRAIAAEGGGIASTVRATREASDDALFELTAARARALRAFGVTACEAKSGYGLSLEHELRSLRVLRRVDEAGLLRVSATFLGAHAIPPERRDDRARYVDEVVEEVLPAVAEEGLADAVDVYCDDGAFTLAEARRVLTAGKAHGLAVRAHAGQFADLGAVELVAELAGLSADHLEVVSDAGVAAMAAAGVVAVLLPGAWRTLRQEAPRAERFREAGVAMAIGTDLNPGTSPTADLPLMAALAVRDAGMTIEESLLGITTAAARAAGFGGGAGTLRVGGPADLAVFATPDPRSLAYGLGGARASLVLLGGRIVVEAAEPLIW